MVTSRLLPALHAELQRMALDQKAAMEGALQLAFQVTSFIQSSQGTSGFFCNLEDSPNWIPVDTIG